MILFGIDHRIVILFGLFGFVCPRIFGMVYLLIPAFVGQTFVDQRLAGVHFSLAYLGLGALVLDHVLETSPILYASGVLCWTLGVFVFVGSLLVSVKPKLRTRRYDCFAPVTNRSVRPNWRRRYSLSSATRISSSRFQRGDSSVRRREWPE